MVSYFLLKITIRITLRQFKEKNLSFSLFLFFFSLGHPFYVRGASLSKAHMVLWILWTPPVCKVCTQPFELYSALVAIFNLTLLSDLNAESLSKYLLLMIYWLPLQYLVWPLFKVPLICTLPSLLYFTQLLVMII